MAYKNLSVGMPANFVAGTINPGFAFGSDVADVPLSIPAFPALALSLWSGSGTKLGKANLLTLASGTLINTTPNTTDTADIDLKAALDVLGASKVYVSACLLAVLNFSTTDTDNILVGGAVGTPATNPWTAPFQDMATPNLGRIRVPAGYVDPDSSKVIPGVAILFAGNTTALAVGTTSKVLRLYSPSSNASGVPYRVVVAGRDA